VKIQAEILKAQPEGLEDAVDQRSSLGDQARG